MKKLILSLLACGTVGAAQAQMGLLLYGTGTYASSRGEDNFTTGGITTTTNIPRMVMWQVNPGIGWSLNQNWAVGLDINYMGSKLSEDKGTVAGQDYEFKTYGLGVGPFVRYTKMLGEHFFVYGQFTADYLRGHQMTLTTPNLESKDQYMGFRATAIPAVGVRVSPTVGLSFGVGGVGFQYLKLDNDAPTGSTSEGKRSDFAVTFGQQFNFTLQKYCNWAPRSRHHRDSDMEEMDGSRRMERNNDDE